MGVFVAVNEVQFNAFRSASDTQMTAIIARLVFRTKEINENGYPKGFEKAREKILKNFNGKDLSQKMAQDYSPARFAEFLANAIEEVFEVTVIDGPGQVITFSKV